MTQTICDLELEVLLVKPVLGSRSKEETQNPSYQRELKIKCLPASVDSGSLFKVCSDVVNIVPPTFKETTRCAIAGLSTTCGYMSDICTLLSAQSPNGCYKLPSLSGITHSSLVTLHQRSRA